MAKKKQIPAWYRRRARARGLVVGSQILWTPNDIVALIERVNARYQALAMAIANTPTTPTDVLGSDWRAAWASHYRAWLDFREEGSDVWSTMWGATATSAQAFDQELDAWRQAFEERTGEEVSTPLESDTAEQGRPNTIPAAIAGETTKWALIGLGLGVVALALRSR